MVAVTTAINAISDLWESTVPYDRPAVSYFRMGAKGSPKKTTSNARGFAFTYPRRGETVIQSDSIALVIWETTAMVLLDGTGRSHTDLGVAAAEESHALAAAVESHTTWPGSIRSVRVTSADAESDDEGTDSVLSIGLAIECWEQF